MFLPQTAAALLDIHAHNGDVTLTERHGHRQRPARRHASTSSQFTDSNIFAGAIALASISAPSGNVDMGALDVEAVMNAPNVNSVGFKFGVVGALAVVERAGGQRHQRRVGDGEGFGQCRRDPDLQQCCGFPLGIGDAVAIANFSAGDSVDIDGNVTVEASYNGVFAQHGIVIAALHVNAIDGSASIDGNVTVDGTLQLTGKFGEFGLPSRPSSPLTRSCWPTRVIEADSGVTVTGDMDVTANVQAKSVKFNAFGRREPCSPARVSM